MRLPASLSGRQEVLFLQRSGKLENGAGNVYGGIKGQGTEQFTRRGGRKRNPVRKLYTDFILQIMGQLAHDLVEHAEHAIVRLWLCEEVEIDNIIHELTPTIDRPVFRKFNQLSGAHHLDSLQRSIVQS
ncbi:MAG: hypothetical protein ACKOD3_04185 [Phenylobacterium sp.]